MTRGLDFTTMHIPFVAGLNQKAEWRANQPPSLDVALDVQFDDLGGVQLRKPFAALGSAQSNVRKIVSYGDELLMFDINALYSWSPTTSAWATRATHRAVAMDETPRFAGRSDQIECDRAELNNTVVVAWKETIASGGTTLDVAYAAAFDKVTGAVLKAPTSLGQGSRPRVVALSTKILLFVLESTGDLTARAIDPASPGAGISIASTGVLTAAGDAMNTYFDVEKIPGADSCIVGARITPTTSYTLAKVTAAIAVTKSTKARTCDGPIAVACTDDGATLQVIRGNGTAIQGDRITISSLADAATGQSIGTATGTPVNQITAAYDDGGTCMAFWHAEESTSAPTQETDGFHTAFNTVDTSGTIGTAAVFVAGLGIASRAFTDGLGGVYVNLTHAGTSILNSVSGTAFDAVSSDLQNTYFLYQHDQVLLGKSVYIQGGGFPAATGHLPGVQSLGSNRFAWCAIRRRRVVVSLDEIDGFAARAPQEVIIEFDTIRGRRTAQLGRTLYITGSEVKQYDSVSLIEAGFHTFWWHATPTQGVSASGLADGDYFYLGSYRFDNAQGELDRSPRVLVKGVSITGGPDKVGIGSITPLRATHKTAVAVEIWRSPVNPADGTDYFLITDPDPSNRTNPNMYLANPATTSTSFVSALDDQFDDAALQGLEPVAQDAFPGIAPPGASIIAANDTRLFLAGIQGEPHRVWYSKQRIDGQVAAFHGSLAFDVPQPGGDITAIAFLNETLIVFRETACYSIPGDGFDNAGDGQNYGPPRLISADIGAVSAEAVATTPSGLIFKSKKGWYLLNGAQGLQYIGGAVADYDSEDPVSVVVVESQHQIRCLTSSRMLVLDYLVQQWAEWSISGGVDACMWRNTYTLTTSTQPKTQAADYTGVTYGIDIETPWIKPADLLGDCKVRYIEILGEYRGDHDLWVRIARDYDISTTGDPGTPNWHTTEYQSIRTAANGNVVGKPLEVRVFPAQQNCTAIKIRITAVSNSDHGDAPSTAGCRLTGLSMDVAIRGRTGSRVPPPPSAPVSG
jgi:hypothetical protein